jgi:hypothetical protein
VRKLALATAVVAGAVLAVAACALSDEEAAFAPVGDAAATPGEGGISSDAGGGGQLEANAIVLVHAASFPAFRICFENAQDELPQPSADLMPESNVVGLDVGTALRFPARSEILGRAFVYLESSLRALYPLDGDGPTCAKLLTTSIGAEALFVGEITESLARGVHALVLGGCRGTTADPTAGPERCGDDWSAASGNLRLRTIPLPAYARYDETRLPLQLLQLSPSLDRRAAGRALGLAVGTIDAGADALPTPIVEGAARLGVPVPTPPVQLAYAADLGSFATTGVFVTLGDTIGDAGAPLDAGQASEPRELVLAQSLADIQRRSSPRSVPPDWFATASSYVVVSLGDLDPRTADGGPDDDPRRALHLLAVPLGTPDAGIAADAGAPDRDAAR